jgi:hypothetical protein
MGGALAHDTEVAGRADDPASKVIMPDAIHHHARGQRILGIGEPTRQRGATSGRLDALERRHRRGLRIEDRQESRLDLFFRRVVDADRK